MVEAAQDPGPLNTEGDENQEQIQQAELGEAELEILCKFLQETIASLLAVNKNLLNVELHAPERRELLLNFAQDKGMRALVVAKIEKPQAAVVDGDSSTQLSDTQSSIRQDGNIELHFSSTVEYLGPSAQSIAFLKREDFAKLDLSVGMDLEKVLEAGITSADSASTHGGESQDLSNQVQIVNLGYLGQDSNLFELASTYMDFSFMPLFQDYKNKTQVSATGGDQSQSAFGGLDGILKGLSMLKSHLSLARQNTEIPKVELTIDSEIKIKFDQAAKKGTFVALGDFDDKFQDKEFLNRLHNQVQGWYKEIRKVTTLEHNIESGTASQEINFWAQMDSSLRFIKEQLVRDEVKMTLDILMQSNMHRRIVFAFRNDTEIGPKHQKAQNYNKLLKDIPIQDLLDSTTLEGMKAAVKSIFQILGRIRTYASGYEQNSYSLERAVELTECIARDFDTHLKKILSDRPIMQIPFEEHKILQLQVNDLEVQWQNSIRELKNQLARAGGGGGGHRIQKGRDVEQRLKNIEDDPVFKRLNQISTFRSEHQKLESVISTTFASGGGEQNQGANGFRSQALKDIREAFKTFIQSIVDMMDISKEGQESWDQAKKAYELSTAKIESQLTTLLKQKLAKAQTANEMFQVFNDYNQLLMRPKIKGTVAQYQSQLLNQVEKDIEVLKKKLLNQEKMDKTLNTTRDIPEISENIVWMNQLQTKLKFYQDKVSKILGEDWKSQQDGQRLSKTCESLQGRLTKNQKEVFDKWIKRMLYRDNLFYQAKNVLYIQQRGNKLQLCLNLEEDILRLYKEKNSLVTVISHFDLQMNISHLVRYKADEFQKYTPIATSLQQSLRTFLVTLSKVAQEFDMLFAAKKNSAMKELLKGLETPWRLEQPLKKYARKVLVKVIAFEEEVNSVMLKTDLIKQLLDEMKECPLERQEFESRLTTIQNIIGDFDLEDLSNLTFWVAQLNEAVEEILISRLEQLLQSWIKEFTDFEEINQTPDGGTFVKNSMVLDLKLQNRQILLEPSLAEAKAFWYKELHGQVEVICGLERLTIRNDEGEKTYKGLLNKMNDSFNIRSVYMHLEETFQKAKEYVATWRNYQSLWDIDQQKDIVYKQLGEEIDLWNQLLNEITQSRRTFETAENFILFGGLEISYGAVQQKVSNKYDQIHNDILNKFGTTLAGQMKAFQKELQAARRKLEGLNIDVNDDVTVFVTEIQEMNRVVETWEAQLKRCKAGEKLLIQQRYNKPADWLSMDQISGDWQTFMQQLTKKSTIMTEKTPELQKKILEEDEVVTAKIQKINHEWKENRPKEASSKPDQASPTIKKSCDQLRILGGEIEKTIIGLQRVSKAKELLEMEMGDPNQLDYLREDQLNLLEVWTKIAAVWKTIDDINATPFQGYVHKAVKEGLEIKTQEMRDFPNKMRSYQVYEIYLNHLKNYKKVNDIFADLRDDSMKPKHWKDLLRKMNIRTKQSDLTLADLWNADLLGRNKIVSDVLTQARGEAILETFINNIKECWTTRELELVRYQNKCKLIKGWDDLFAEVDEHMNAINGMKMSPYYKVFEKDIEPWSKNLEQIRVTFDYWIDVQRRYVYLEGIFFGSADIKSMLSNEFTKFKNIDSDFTKLMKHVNKQPIVLEVMKIPNLEKTLQNFTASLQLIQKALGEYLEKQRQNFARFYFVGDEDLLEIIGNSKEIKNVMRHFPKMFQGISTVNHENEGDEICGMNSREGESVAFHKNIIISEDPTIYVWLTKVEQMMQVSLAMELEKGVKELELLDRNSQQDEFNAWIINEPAQIAILAMQVSWSQRVEDDLEKKSGATLRLIEESIRLTLEMLADRVLMDLPGDIRKKYEQIITDLVHQREVSQQLIREKVIAPNQFSWLYHMRFYFNTRTKDVLEKLNIRMANGQFFYGFEYLGVAEKLVQTPLTDRCYLTLTQALHWRMGGSPFGPAGTGKTESVKALGSQLGRFVLVFNCDETFDGNAMNRIFVGLCQVGAWGCFDEFNRLEERMLSAVSQSILTIQMGLREQLKRIDLMARDVKLNPHMGIFITMNPGYAGRSALPDNLKQLFRQVAMVRPDKDMIARVMLYSQGFKTADKLAGKIVSLFELCLNQLSSQSHYDFGLRALKSVLNISGTLKRKAKEKVIDPSEIDEKWEANILIKSLNESLVPKLIADDIPLLTNLLQGVFPGIPMTSNRDGDLIESLRRVSSKYNLMPQQKFIEKCMQLYEIQNLHHGVMMVGPTGCGKSAAWKLLLDCMTRTDGIKGESYVIDPKAISKDDLYGKLDATTAEWTDGVFTGILRRIIDNARGEMSKRHWLIFDGDVDPEWAENLNSVLDDNKLLTLPSGERLSIPPNVRIMFEVETLKHATLATVSRCGMVWFSEETVSNAMMYHHYLRRLSQDIYDNIGEEVANEEQKKEDQDDAQAKINVVSEDVLQARLVRKQCVAAIKSQFDGGEEDYCFATRAVDYAEKEPHIMEFTKIRVLEAFFALLRKGIENILVFNEERGDFPLEESQISSFMKKWLLFSALWGIGGSMNLQTRSEFSNKITEYTDIECPPIGPTMALIDYEVRIEDQKWHAWKDSVPVLDIEPRQVTDADFVITTVDTNRHQQVLCSWLSEKRPFLLCGPPGSGKTMTLMATLKMLTDMEMVFINFSSSTTPELILKTFEQYCETKKTNTGFLMSPTQASKWLVIFCDEINLPASDKYGTQVVITFLRQMTEQNGFYRTSDKQWVKLERIMFVGACNPPSDVGRQVMSDRFLRHAPLIYIDFPGPESLKQIYGTFNRAMLKRVPPLRSHADSMTEAMVDFYTRAQRHYTADQQSHYIYSPRELTRWKYAINEALEPLEEPEDLVRLMVHEGLRLYEDRLVFQYEKDWCNETIDSVVKQWFPTINHDKALTRPIYFTNYLHKNYMSVGQDELKVHIEARLKQFYEEELNVPLVVFDSVLDHILRIDRVLRQPVGHLLLVGASGVGKTTLTRFVAWMQDLAVFQIKAGRNYSVFDFDEDLRKVMRQAGIEKRKTVFVFDESNVLGAAFLERMNALLAAGEVPGLFDGDDYTKLIQSAKEEARKNNLMLEEDELYKQFTKDVQRNLHVVFTMNPANPDFANRSASSPALFNRCVIDWFGDWTDDGLLQVALEFTKNLDIPSDCFSKDMDMNEQNFTDGEVRLDPKHELLSQCIVDIHITVRELNLKLSKSAKKFNYITPRDFLDFIHHFVDLTKEKRTELEELQSHLEVGINKLQNTERSVQELSEKLKVYDLQLKNKKTEATAQMKLLAAETTKVEQSTARAERTKKELEAKNIEIEERAQVVNYDLGRAEPALIAAQSSVQGVQQKDIKELQGYSKPSDKIRLGLESCIVLVKNMTKAPNWASEVIPALKNASFKSSIMDFDKEQISPACKKFLTANYLSKDTYDIAGFHRASKALGPLAEWTKSIIEFADIFERIAPLRQELQSLEAEKNTMEEEMNATLTEIDELEASKDRMTREYQQLVQEQNNIENEQKTVKNKVVRSESLYRNLSSELHRWQGSSQNFKERLASLLGDTLMSSAVLTYIGFFDFHYRQVLKGDWADHVELIALKQSPALSYMEFLSKPQDRILWQQEELPSDDLCIENAIIMSRFNRYPLIIDPSDQALKYVMNHFRSRKIQKTSFADPDFLARISEGLQYGVPVLIQDVEKIDPVMNSVLNKEVQKVGGRLVMQVGDKEIACNGELTLFMLTRNQNALFTPDLCSRVTFVNFTVTPSSLNSQCLNIFMKNEREEIDRKRSDLLKHQGEFKEKLRLAEDQLLNALNQSKGEILDNDELIQTLESLKKEAAEISEQVAKTDETLEEIKEVTNEYGPLATMTTRIFFSLESLGTIHYLYQYSLHHFMATVFEVLKNNEEVNKVPKSDPQMRLQVIIKQLFIRINNEMCHGLLEEHKLIFTLRLAQIRIGDQPGCDALFELFLQTTTSIVPNQLSTALLGGKLTKSQLAQIEDVASGPHLNGLVASMESDQDRWIQVLDHPEPMTIVPEPWMTGDDISLTNECARLLKKLVIMKILRRDRLPAGVSQLAIKSMGQEVDEGGPVDLATFTGGDNFNPKSPLLLVSAPGYDASYKVDTLAKQFNKKYTSVAIGSPEAFGLVDTAIRNAAKSGNWVLLKNVHLAPQWLVELEKKIYNMNLDKNFRLFLTMENNPKVPSTLLRASHVLVFEPPSGIKAALVRSYSQSITQERTNRDPVERKRLHFLVSWFNAIVQERLRYTPIGWSKVYEFNEADQRCTLDCIDEWLDSMGKNRTNVDPDKIPWDALRTLISQSIFGGKIDNQFDNKILNSLVDQFFRPESYNNGFRLFEPVTGGNEATLTVPEEVDHAGFVRWIKAISLDESPAWSGLPNNVEKIVRERLGSNLLSKIKMIQGTGDDLGDEEEAADGKATWLVQLESIAGKMLDLLPSQLELLTRTAQAIQNPLFRFLEREVTVASGLLELVKTDLIYLIEMCKGTRKSTNMLKKLAEDLNAEVIPDRWRKYTVANVSATIWVNDFVRRVIQLQELSKRSDFGQSGLWLGGLLFPEAYLTATRQSVAQKNSWSLEELTMDFQINPSEDQLADNESGFVLSGFSMQGAEYSIADASIRLTESLGSNLPIVNLKWVHKSQVVEEAEGESIEIPVYLNKQRTNLITAVMIKTQGVPSYVWYQRGVAFFSWATE